MEKQILREKITQLSHKVNKIERDFYDKDLNVPFNNKIIVSGFKTMKPEKINELDTQPKKNYVVKENPKTEIEKEKERKEPLDNKLFVKNKFDSDQCLNNLISEKKIDKKIEDAKKTMNFCLNNRNFKENRDFYKTRERLDHLCQNDQISKKNGKSQMILKDIIEKKFFKKVKPCPDCAFLLKNGFSSSKCQFHGTINKKMEPKHQVPKRFDR